MPRHTFFIPTAIADQTCQPIDDFFTLLYQMFATAVRMPEIETTNEGNLSGDAGYRPG